MLRTGVWGVPYRERCVVWSLVSVLSPRVFRVISSWRYVLLP